MVWFPKRINLVLFFILALSQFTGYAQEIIFEVDEVPAYTDEFEYVYTKNSQNIFIDRRRQTGEQLTDSRLWEMTHVLHEEHLLPKCNSDNTNRSILIVQYLYSNNK